MTSTFTLCWPLPSRCRRFVSDGQRTSAAGPERSPSDPKRSLLSGTRLATDRRSRCSSRRGPARADRRRRPGIVPGTARRQVCRGLSDRQVAALARGPGGVTRSTRSRFADFHLRHARPDDVDVAAAARALAAEPGVVYAEPVARRYARLPPQRSACTSIQWNLQQLDFERAWDINTGAANAVVVAVIDSGVAYRRSGCLYAQAPDLAGTTFVPGYDFIWDDDTPLDFDGHGTHVTGTIAQSTNNNLGHGRHSPSTSASCPSRPSAASGTTFSGAPNVGTAAPSPKPSGLPRNTAPR